MIPTWRRSDTRACVRALKKKNLIQLESNLSERHIILIVIDCLRKDHLSVSGYKRQTTPFLDSLLDTSAIFNAISASSWTYPSEASILTGLYPHHHCGVFKSDLRYMDSKNLPSRLCKEVISLPEMLSFLGFDILIDSANFLARLPFMGRTRARTGRLKYLLSGTTKRPSRVLINNLMNWMRKRMEKNTFSCLHLNDLHSPLNLPKGFEMVFGKIEDVPNIKRWDYGKGNNLDTLGFKKYKENRIKLYDSILRYIDQEISRLFSWLKKNRFLETTTLIITADHGEEFWDHTKIEKEFFFDPRDVYGIGHGHSVFNELLNVPLILSGYDIESKIYKNKVSLVDIVPTILKLLGINYNYAFDGRNLFKTNKENRIILSEDTAYGFEKKAIHSSRYKLIRSMGDGITLLFDVSRDPKEKKVIQNKKIESKLVKCFPDVCWRSNSRARK